MPSNDGKYDYYKPGAFCIGKSKSSLNPPFDLPNTYLSFVRKLIKNDRLVFNPEFELGAEVDSVVSASRLVEGSVCSDEAFLKESKALSTLNVTSASKIAKEEVPDWWRPPLKEHRKKVLTMKLFHILKTF